MAIYIYEQKDITFKYPFDNIPSVTVHWKNENGKMLPPLVEPNITVEGFSVPSFQNITDDINEVYAKMEWVAVANTSTNRLTINTTPDDAEVNVEFYNPEVVFTINPTPSNADVTLTADGYTQEGNSIAVEPETLVQYKVGNPKNNFYGWSSGDSVVYTLNATPSVGELVYDDLGNKIIDKRVGGFSNDILTLESPTTPITIKNLISYSLTVTILVNDDQTIATSLAANQTITFNTYVGDVLTICETTYGDYPGGTYWLTINNQADTSKDGDYPYGSNVFPYTYTIAGETTINLSTSSCCVPYYSQILYPNNITKSAEDVQIGDIIMGYDSESHQMLEVVVKGKTIRDRYELTRIIFSDDTILETTPEHPILTNKGWACVDVIGAHIYITNEGLTNIQKLKENYKVMDKNGVLKQIKAIQTITLDEKIKCYTFDTTDMVDTYIADGYVVHNAGCK